MFQERKKIYMDFASTTPTDPAVVEAMLPWFSERFGNPSSSHTLGQEAKRAIEEARKRIASFLGAVEDEIIFTGSGTESDNFALKGVASALKTKGDHIITSMIEHHAVLETCRYLEGNGFRVTYLKADRSGMIDPDEMRHALTDKTILVTIMHANNEIGTIQPIAEIGKIAGECGIYFHTDAVQTFGHISTNVKDLGVDLFECFCP